MYPDPNQQPSTPLSSQPQYGQIPCWPTAQETASLALDSPSDSGRTYPGLRYSGRRGCPDYQ